MQPDDLYRAIKDRELPASELLQAAVRAELRRQEILEQIDRYIAELIAEVGETGFLRFLVVTRGT